MSHFTRIHTEFVEEAAIVAALNDLGIGPVELHESPVRLKGWGAQAGRRPKARIVVRKRHLRPSYTDLGFQETQKGTWQLWADSAYLRRHATVLSQLKSRYAYHTSINVLKKQGYRVIEESTGDTGEIRLVLQRTA